MKFSQQTREVIYQRAGRCCERCPKSAEGGSIHHRRPRGMGGTKDPAAGGGPNGVLLCGSGTTGCHGEVESNRVQAIADGWLVPQGVDPATVPIRHRTLGRVWLDDDGMYLHQNPTDRSTP